ncbi:MAG: histidinol-phosphatase HisJ family protein [Christensenellales bacterium]
MIDTHTHCSHSQDCKIPPQQMIEAAIDKGLEYIAITDHYDLDMLRDFPEVPQIDLPHHFAELSVLKDKYAGKIEVGVGIEVGWAKQVEQDYADNLSQYDFDMTINSIHLINGKDCYLPGYYDDIPMQKCYDDYLDSVISSLDAPYRFDSIGHLGYIMRKAPYADPIMKYPLFADKIDAILTTLITKGVALELNSHVKELPVRCLPTTDILKRYRQLGGELITFGSDAHQPYRLADKYSEVCQILKDAGFRYVFKYIKHQPLAHKL